MVCLFYSNGNTISSTAKKYSSSSLRLQTMCCSVSCCCQSVWKHAWWGEVLVIIILPAAPFVRLKPDQHITNIIPINHFLQGRESLAGFSQIWIVHKDGAEWSMCLREGEGIREGGQWGAKGMEKKRVHFILLVLFLLTSSSCVLIFLC